jgi:integrase
MQPKITRYLKAERVDRFGRQKIHMRVCWSGFKVRFSTGESVNPNHWQQGIETDDDANRGWVTKAGGVVGKNVNRRLRTYTSELEKYFDRLVTPKPMEVQAEIDRIRTECLGRETKVKPEVVSVTPALPTLKAYIPMFLQERKADRSKSWRATMEVIGKHLEGFRPGIDWSDLTLSTLNHFKVYMQDEMEHSDATLETYVGLLRGMLKYAGRSGMPVPPDWTYLELRSVGDAILPELQHDEIIKLADADISGVSIEGLGLPSRSERSILYDTRWYFLVACGTGLRHSDLWQIQSPKITYIENVPCVEVFQQKTKRRVPIPLNDETFELLKTPAKGRPEEGWIYNKALKPIAEQAKLTRSVMVGSYYKGDLVSEYMPLHQAINSHMARRTYATLMTAGGMPTRTLQEILGQSSIASTERYAKVSNPMIVHQ